MEELPIIAMKQEPGLIACCECGTPIAPNPANMCVACVRSKFDITEGIPRYCEFFIFTALISRF
jgi:nonsense-mediated mRNA decay protein 3